MARTEDIVRGLVDATGKSIPEMTLMVRRLRENDYWVRETRSPRSPRPAPINVACLLVSILSGATAKDAPNAVRDSFGTVSERYEGHEADIAALESFGTFRNTVSLLRKGEHVIAEAIEAMIKDAIEHPVAFKREKVIVRISLDRPIYGGNIDIRCNNEGGKERVILPYMNVPLIERVGFNDLVQIASIGNITLSCVADTFLEIDH